MAVWRGLFTGAMLAAIGAALGAACRRQSLKSIDVERINIREPDGTLRLVIAGKNSFPGSFFRGREVPRPDRRFAAGMLFLNDEGTENGGLIWAGKSEEGKREAGASLTFDRYENDQTLQLLQKDASERDIAALVISDRPDQPMFEESGGEITTRGEAMGGATRLFVGKSQDRASVVMLQDACGRPRIVLRVEPCGEASIDFLNDKGSVVRSLRADN